MMGPRSFDRTEEVEKAMVKSPAHWRGRAASVMGDEMQMQTPMLLLLLLLKPMPWR